MAKRVKLDLTKLMGFRLAGDQARTAPQPAMIGSKDVPPFPVNFTET